MLPEGELEEVGIGKMHDDREGMVDLNALADNFCQSTVRMSADEAYLNLWVATGCEPYSTFATYAIATAPYLAAKTGQGISWASRFLKPMAGSADDLILTGRNTLVPARKFGGAGGLRWEHSQFVSRK